MHYWRPRLCRVFLHSVKSPLHSAKTLPSVALGKVRSAKFFSAKGLCRVLFIGALGKIKNNFAECLGRHSAKYFRSFHRSRLFCRGPDPALGKKKIIFFKDYFAECPSPGTRQSFLIIFFKNYFAECPVQALGNFFLFF